MNGRRAVVIGGSLGGLFAANLLRASGWSVTVYERSVADLSSRGAGLGTHDSLFAVLRRIGILVDDGIGIRIRSRLCLNPDGTVHCEVPIASVATAWDCVYRALRSALPAPQYKGGMALDRVKQEQDVARAVFSNGAQVEADLLIAADGIHSTVRQQFIPDAKARYAGYVAWRGAVDAADVPHEWHRLTSEHMNFCFPEGELALSVPMPASASGGAGRVQITWFRPADLEIGLREWCIDDAGAGRRMSIAPGHVRPAVIDELKQRAEILAPQMAALFRALQNPVLQPIFDFEASRLVFGRVVLLGDAAFVARPHVGTGVTKAALDAALLADNLLACGSDLNTALKSYEAERLGYGRRLVARGRELGAYLEAQLKPRDERRQGELYRSPALVMRQFGAAGEAQA